VAKLRWSRRWPSSVWPAGAKAVVLCDDVKHHVKEEYSQPFQMIFDACPAQ
jgi:hypothetical protein